VPTCFSSIHILQILVSVIFVGLLLIYLVLIALFFFNFSFSQTDSFSRSSNIMHFFFRLFSVAVVSLDIFMDQTNKVTTMLFVHSIGSVVFLIDYYNRIPYYKSSTSEVYCLAISAYFWISVVLLLTDISGLEIIKENVIYIIIIGLGFFLYIVRSFRVFYQRKMVVQEIDEINEEVKLDVRFRYLINVVKNSKKNK